MPASDATFAESSNKNTAKFSENKTFNEADVYVTHDGIRVETDITVYC